MKIPARLNSILLAVVGIVAGFSLLLAPYIGYLSVNSRVQWYDDEGYVMLSLRGFMKSGALYSKIYSQYGPVFYEFFAALYTLSGVALTHDSNRLVTLALWGASATLMGLFAWRHSGSRWVGVFAFLLLFYFLEVTVKEPGHPQQLCFFLLSVGLWVARSDERPASFLALGAIASALALCKVNLGAFFFAAVLMALGLGAENRGWGRSLRIAGFILAVMISIFPLAVGITASTAALAATMGTSALALHLIGAAETPLHEVRAKVLLLLVSAGVLTAGLAIAWILMRGSTLSALVSMTLLQHVSMSNRAESGFSWIGAVVGLFGLAGAWIWHPGRQPLRPESVARLKAIAGFALLAVVIAGFFIDAHTRLNSPGALRGNARILWEIGPAVAWLILIPGQGEDPKFAFSRRLLATTALTSVLIAHPVAGSQTTFATALLLVIALLLVADACRHGLVPNWPARLARAGLTLGLALTSGAFLLHGAYLYRGYHRDGVNPALVGASNMRLAPQHARVLSDLVANVREQCEVLVSLPGFNSLYFWTGIEPPTGWNLTTWPYFLTREQQDQIVAALDHSKRPCVVYYEPWGYLNASLPEGDAGFFGRHVLAHYRPLGRSGPYLVLGRP